MSAAFQQSPQARFPIVEQPGALPGSCLLCNGSHTEERNWFVDTQLQAEWHGAVYICKLCLIEMAETVGFATPPVVSALRETVLELQRQNFNLQTEVSAFHDMEKAIDSFARSRAARRHPSRSSDSSASTLHVHEPDESTESDSSGGEDSLGAGEGTPPESVDGEGVVELRPDAISTEFKFSV